MNLNIDFSADVENLLRQSAADSGLDIAGVIRQIVTERIANRFSATPKRKLSHDEFMAKLRNIVALHPVSNGKMDDSRESIYAGCGESS